MFLKPSLSEVSIIYTLPLKQSVWMAYIALVAILTVAMFVTHRMQHQMDPSQPSLPFGDAVLTSLALMCQEGKAGDTLSSRHVSSCDVTSAVGIFHIELWRILTHLSTLLTSRDLTWSSVRLTYQHASQISVVAHIS
jgi:hypothetical protein